jgi:hypothetical protein
MVDRNGHHIGQIEAIYLDYETDAPEWALVRHGRFGSRPTFVPLEGAVADEGTVRAPFMEDAVREAPDVAPEDELSEDAEVALYRHYGIPASPGPEGEAGDATSESTRSTVSGEDKPPGEHPPRARRFARVPEGDDAIATPATPGATSAAPSSNGPAEAKAAAPEAAAPEATSAAATSEGPAEAEAAPKPKRARATKTTKATQQAARKRRTAC